MIFIVFLVIMLYIMQKVSSLYSSELGYTNNGWSAYNILYDFNVTNFQCY